MAEVTIQTKIDAADAAQTIQELRKSLKDLINAQAQVTQGSDEWKKLGKAINDTEGKIGDLTDSFNTLKGSGVERLNASFGLLREGLFSLDPGKLTMGFKGLGGALMDVGKTLLTNPLFLIAGVIVGIGAAIVSLKDKFAFFRELFDTIGSVIDAVTGKLKEWSDALLDTTFQAEEAAHKQVEAMKNVADAVKERYERELAMANAYGKSTVELEQQKSKAIIKAIDDQINAIVKEAQIRGFINDEEKKQIEELGKERKKELLANDVARAKQYKDLVDGIKKEQDERKKAADDRIKKAQETYDRLAKNKEANEKALADLEYDIWKANYEKEKANEEAKAKEELARKEKQEKELADIELYWANWAKSENEKIEAEVKAQKEKDLETDKKMLEEAAYKQLDIAKGVADVAMQLQTNEFNDKKRRIEEQLQNDELTAEQQYQLKLELFNAEEDFRKKQFALTKAFNVAVAIQDGIRSVTGALAQTSTLGPGAIALAATNGLIAAANVAKILATKYEGGTPPQPPKFNAPAPSGNNIPQTENNQNNLQSQPGTVIKERPIIVKVSEINDVQDRVARVEEQAVF